MKLTINILTLFTLTLALTSCEGQNKKSTSKSEKFNEKIVYLTSTDKSGQLMKEEEFWNIIDKSRQTSSNNYQTQINSLKTILLTFDATEIEKFDNTFTALMSGTYNYTLWGASFVINGGCSDDCFEYFRQYLIGHGKQKFYQTFKDPDSCVDWIKSEEEDNWEGLQYSALEAYRQKTGKDIPKTFKAKYELKGKPFDEEKVGTQYPKLAKKFM